MEMIVLATLNSIPQNLARFRALFGEVRAVGYRSNWPWTKGDGRFIKGRISSAPCHLLLKGV